MDINHIHDVFLFHCEEKLEELDPKSQKITFHLKDYLGAGFSTLYQIFDGLYVGYSEQKAYDLSHDIPHQFNENILILHHVIKGEAYIHLDGNISAMFSAGDTVIYHGNHAFLAGGTGPDGITCFSIMGTPSLLLPALQSHLHFDEDDLSPIHHMFIQSANVIVAPTHWSVEPLIQKFVYASKTDDLFTLKTTALNLFFQDILLFPEYLRQRKAHHKRDHVEKAERALAYMKAHLDSPLTLSQLSQYCGLNKTYLKEIFPKLYGQPPMTYFRDLRLQEAHRLLQNGWSVLDAAQAIGYENPSKFSRAFKDKYGLLPSHLKS